MYIFNELPTAFPWYDKKGKQHRYRENAAKLCDYRLISPYNALLPFQLKIDYSEAVNIFDKSSVFEEGAYLGSGGQLLENENNVRTVFVPVTGGETLFFRTGIDFNNLCAFFDENYTYISSVSGITDLTGTISVPLDARYAVFNVSKNSRSRWPYDKFVFTVSREPIPDIFPGNIVSWKIYSCCGNEIDISGNIGLVHTRMYPDGLRVFYKGENLSFVNHTGNNSPLSLDAGQYYSVLEFSNGNEYFSEVFTIPDDGFLNGGRSRYMRIDFWNECDINPIMYSDGEGGWRQYMYIDTFIHASEPEVEEDGERDGNDMLIPTFQRMVVRYRFSAVVPDYMKIAIVSLQIHDNVWVTTENGVRSGRVERMSSSATIDDSGAYSTLDVVMEQNVLVKNACCDNMESIELQ